MYEITFVRLPTLRRCRADTERKGGRQIHTPGRNHLKFVIAKENCAYPVWVQPFPVRTYIRSDNRLITLYIAVWTRKYGFANACSFKGVVKTDGEYKQQHWSSHSEGVLATGIQSWTLWWWVGIFAGVRSLPLLTRRCTADCLRQCKRLDARFQRI